MKKNSKKNVARQNNLYTIPGFGETAASQKQSSSQKRKPKLRSLFILVFTLWAMYTFLFVLLPNKTRLDEERGQLEKELSVLQQEEHSLNAELNNLQDDQYIARLARKLYNMIKPGEIPYRPGE